MEWSSGTARAVHYPTTCRITNHNNGVRESEKSTGPAKAAAVLTERFLGIDTAATKHGVPRFIPGEGAKPAEAMNTETLLSKVAKWVKAGVAVHGVDEAGPTGFALYRQLGQTGATCLVVRPKRLERHQRRRKNDPPDCQRSLSRFETCPIWFAPAAKARRALVETLLAVVIVVRGTVAAPSPWHLQCPQCAEFTLVRIGSLARAPPVYRR